MKPLTLRELDRLPSSCTIAVVCRALSISATTFFALRKAGTFPIPEILPRLDSRPRFSGEKVRAYLLGLAESPAIAGDSPSLVAGASVCIPRQGQAPVADRHQEIGR